MAIIMLSYVLLVVGFFLLIKGADILVKGASALAKKYNISDLVIGLTVVAFGTSSPELFVSIMASLKGSTDITVGNILGSNISNILLILGVASIIFPLNVTKGTVWKGIPFSLLAALVLGILANDRLIDQAPFSMLTRIDGMILLSFFIIFMYYSVSIAKKIDGMEDFVPENQISTFRSISLVLMGLVGLGLGGKWIVDGAVYIALSFGISESFVGLTIVAIGTSLPELATSIIAATRKKVEIAVGNVVGSNIFNIFLVLGVNSIIKPISLHPESNMDIGVVIFSTILLFAYMFTGKRRSLDRWEGIFFIIFYLAYLTFLIIKA